MIGARQMIGTRLGLLAVAWVFVAEPGLAIDCGEDDCGPYGSCDPAGLKARCACEEGFVSVSTYIPDSNFGAFCVPIGALPSESLCADAECGPHGVCVVQDGAAQCVCDSGYRATDELTCVDDEADPAEEVCTGVNCGDDATCMAVSDAVTCRCAAGGTVVLGQRLGEDLPDPFGPACSYPLSREDACGPDLCGPFGQCVLGQAVICDCEPGYEEQDRTVAGRRRGYCVEEGTPLDPEAPPEPELVVGSRTADAGSSGLSESDAGAADATDSGDSADGGGDGSQPDRTPSSGCALWSAGSGQSGVGFYALLAGAIAFLRRRRSSRR